MSESHADQIVNHRLFADTYTDAAARTAATGFPRGTAGAIVPFDSSDLGKAVWQLNDNSFWILLTATPTWLQFDAVLERIQDIVGVMLTDNDDLDWTYNDGAGTETATVKGTANALSPATETLTDGATVTWATAGKRINNAQVTLGGNRTLDITGEVDGATGTLLVIQDGTGERTLTLPGSSKVINGGAGAVVLSTAANKIDILTWILLGSTFYWTIGKDYS